MVTVILPAYNEEECVEEVIEDVRSTMEKTGHEYEIILVDDASTDRTGELAREKGVKVIRHAVNRGSGASRKTGILNSQGDIIVMLDVDGTYPAHRIPDLLEHFPEYDQVIGAREAEKGTMKWLRFPAKALIRRLACFLSRTYIPDLNTGLRAFKKDVIMKYLYLVPNGFSCVTTMTLSFLCGGENVKYVPIEYYPRSGGKSKFHPIKDTQAYILTVFRMIMYFDPLRVIMPIFLLTFFLGFLKIGWDYYFKGFLVTSTVIVLLGAVLIAILGMLADLIVVQGRAREHKMGLTGKTRDI